MSMELVENATSTQTPSEAEPQPVSTANITAETALYRTYGIIKTNDAGVAEFKACGEKKADGTRKILDKVLILRETNDGKRWLSAEADENIKLSENKLITYTLENLDGFEELIPDATQRLYIANLGIKQLQTRAAQALQSEVTDDGTAFVYNETTIDLRDALNTPPGKQKLSGLQKQVREFSALSEADRLRFIEFLQAQAGISL